jgi:hypothetical protein
VRALTGNITFRACVKACQPAYIEAKRREKPYIAQRIVVFIRKMGGRFLKREGADSLQGDAWKDVGNNKAREKTSQALREGAPELRGDVKEGVSTTTSAPSVVAAQTSSCGPMPYLHHDLYYEYGGRGPVPKMVTVTSAYDAVPLSAPSVWHHAPPSGIQGGHNNATSTTPTTSARPSKKQKRRESHYAKAAETVLAHCPRPTVVPVVSEGSLSMLGGDHAPTGVSPYRPDITTSSVSAPGTPRVTVSSDEEERSNSSLPSPIRSQRSTSAAASKALSTTAVAAPSTVPSVVVAHSGPRLKLLKKRILSTDS